MNCDEFEDRIHQLLDRGHNLATDPDLRRHARQCAGCRSVRQAYLRLFAGLNRRQLPPLDENFSQRVIQLAQSVGTRDSLTSWRSRRFLAVRSAISLVLLVALTLAFRFHGQGRGVSELAGRDPSKTELTEPADASLAESAIYPPIKLHLPWPVQDPEWVLFWEHFSDHMVGETAESWEVLAGGLRPLAVSLSSVWIGFRDTWPWGHASESPSSPPEPSLEPRFSAT